MLLFFVEILVLFLFLLINLLLVNYVRLQQGKVILQIGAQKKLQVEIYGVKNIFVICEQIELLLPFGRIQIIVE